MPADALRRCPRRLAAIAVLMVLTAGLPGTLRAENAPPKPAAAPSIFTQESAMSGRDLVERWSPLIKEASRRFAIPAQWVRAVLMTESGGRTMLGENAPIISSAGAMGLMQLMPETWSAMRLQYSLGADPYDPDDNVLAGTAYLALLYRQYGYPALFAAYNDGPGMLDAHARLGPSLPAETTAYVLDIASILRTGARRRPGSAGDLLWLLRPDELADQIGAARVNPVPPPPRREYAQDDDDDYYGER